MKLRAFALLLVAACLPALAKVPQNEADALRTRLTPLGGERAGNEDGMIPAWTGGITQAPPCYARGGRYCDPYAGEKPIATITAANIDKWRDRLSAGMTDALLRDAGYSISVYPSHRSFANPGAVYEAAFKNATTMTLSGNAMGVEKGTLGPPFPIPKNGVEPVWNHKLRYRGPGTTRTYTQATMTINGDPVFSRFREDMGFPYSEPDANVDNPVMHYLQIVQEPKRMRGSFLLVHDFPDPVAKPVEAWLQVPVPGSRKIRRAQSFGYDNPGVLSDDLRFDDQIDGFSGNPDRYFWRIIGKKEIVIPYNSYALDSGHKTLREILRPQHLDARYPRYELHRVLVVEASVRPNTVHRYKRRTMYFDEDSWQLVLADLYDAQDRLWRWQETHTVMAYDRSVLQPVVDTVYDLQSGRYVVQGPDEEDPEIAELPLDVEHFTNSHARDLAVPELAGH